MTPKQIARRIVEDLFAHGATRIALKKQSREHPLARAFPNPPELDLGGWCQQAAQDRVEETLKALLKEWGA